MWATCEWSDMSISSSLSITIIMLFLQNYQKIGMVIHLMILQRTNEYPGVRMYLLQISAIDREWLEKPQEIKNPFCQNSREISETNVHKFDFLKIFMLRLFESSCKISNANQSTKISWDNLHIGFFCYFKPFDSYSTSETDFVFNSVGLPLE